jgi:hypothetical protein
VRMCHAFFCFDISMLFPSSTSSPLPTIVSAFTLAICPLTFV